MGSCMSRKLGSSSSSRTIRSLSSINKYEKIIRVVHLNGWLEEFEDPVTVRQVTGNQPKHFVFPQAQLLSLDSKPLDSGAQLELGNIYFLLPHSIFQAEMSPMDLATIYKRLTGAAQKSIKPPNSSSSSSSSSSFNNNNNNNNSVTSSTTATRQQQQPQSKLKTNRYADRYVPPRINTIGDINYNKHMYYDYTSCDSLVMKQQQQQQQVGDQSPCSWKPILESIIERSFTLRSTESDSSHQDTHR